MPQPSFILHRILDKIVPCGKQEARVEVFQEGGRSILRISGSYRKPKPKREGLFAGLKSRTILDMIGIG